MINLPTLQYEVINLEKRMGIPALSIKIPNYIYHYFARKGILHTQVSLEAPRFLSNNPLPNVISQQIDYTPPKHFEESVATSQEKVKSWWNIFSP